MPHPVITNIVLAHHFVSHPGWHSEEHAHMRLSSGIVYVLEGHAEYVMGDGKRFTVRPGDCIYIPKGSVYTTHCGLEESFIHMTVNFELLRDEEVFPALVRRKLSGPVHFEQLFSRLVHHWTVRHPFYHERCIGILYEMIYLLLKEIQSPGSPYLEKLRPARVYLDEHFREEFELEMLPEMCGLSETYFRRLFHRVFNETPAEYRRRLRISYAEDLLLSGRYSISEVAQLCGYPDPAYFSRMFRKTLGVSPSRYVAERFIEEGE